MTIPSLLKQVAAVLYDDAGNRIKAGSASGIAVEGPAASNTAVAGNPVLMGGQDSTPNVQPVTMRTLATNPAGTINAIIASALMRFSNAAGSVLVIPGADNGDAITGTAMPIGSGYVFNGATFDRRRVAIIFKISHAVAVTALTGVTLWTPASGKKFRLLGWRFSSSAAASLLFYDGAAGALTTKIMESELVAATGVTAQTFEAGVLSAAANNTLALDVSATSTVTGMVWGTEE